MNAPIPLSAHVINPLESAVQSYITAKQAEDIATARRLEAEQRLIALLPPKEEGSQTVAVAGYKVTLTGKINYRCTDPRSLAEYCAGAGWSPSLIPIKVTTALDEVGAKWLRQNDPEAWRAIAPWIETKPAKTAIKVGV